MKKLLLALTIAAFTTSALAAGPVVKKVVVKKAMNAIELDGAVAVTTDYRFRGISNSATDAAVQGSITLDTDWGGHLSVWGSSVKYDEAGDNSDASLELDYTAGWLFDITDTVELDVGYTYYTYPQDNGDINLDWGELYADVGWEGAVAGVAFTDDGWGKSGKAMYGYLGYGHEFMDWLTLSAEVGNTWYDEFEFDNGQDRYMNYEVAATATVLKRLDFKVAYIGTDLKKQDIGGLDWAEDAVVGTVTLNL